MTKNIDSCTHGRTSGTIHALLAAFLSVIPMITGCGGGGPTPADATGQLQTACQSMLAAATSGDVQRGVAAFEQLTVATEYAAATLLRIPPTLRPAAARTFQAVMEQFNEQYKLLPNSRDFMRAVRDQPAYDELEDRIDSASDLIKEWARKSPSPPLGRADLQPQGVNAKNLKARAQATTIGQTLHLYMIDQGVSSIPEGFDLFRLVPDYLLERDIIDPWGEPFMVVASARDFSSWDVVSFGADRAPGGLGDAADITN